MISTHRLRGRPKASRCCSQFVYVEGTGKIGGGVTGRNSSPPNIPIWLDKNEHMGVACRLVGNSAFAVVLVPCGLGAPLGYVHHVLAHAIETGRPIASCTITPACASKSI